MPTLLSIGNKPNPLFADIDEIAISVPFE